MTGMARNPQRPVPEQVAILQVPIAEATAFLETQVATGKALEAREVRTAADVNALEHEVQQWRDMNRSWLETRLGGPPAKEYRDVSTHYTIGGRLSPEKELEFLRMYVAGEWNKLESIKNRLSLWAPGATSVVAPSRPVGNSVFVVHGSDEGKAALVARVIENGTDRPAVILHEQPNGGRTLIEKFEHNASEAAYAVVILTADDEGAKRGEQANPRARQNVVFEMGFFFGLVGRSHVCVLYEPGVEKPSDVEGIVYVEWDSAGAWKTKLLTEMAEVGIKK